MRKLNSISIVIPAFNEEKLISKTIAELEDILEQLAIRYQILVIDDGSSDSTLSVLEKLNQENSSVEYLSLSRNFGHQAALRAGIDSAWGDAVITMDADLQHPPGVISDFIKVWEEGFDVVYALRRSQEGASVKKTLFSKLYHYIIKKLADYPLIEGAADFRLLDKKVIKVIRKLSSDATYLRGIIPWFGFSSSCIFYDEPLRSDRSTRYTFVKMLSLAISGVMSVSVRPLRIILVAGMMLSALAFFYGLYAIWIKFFSNQAVPGWTSILASVVFLGGLQLATLGLIGEYLAKMFVNSLDRPAYIIKQQSEKPSLKSVEVQAV